LLSENLLWLLRVVRAVLRILPFSAEAADRVLPILEQHLRGSAVASE
jgi:hypothetical protein